MQTGKMEVRLVRQGGGFIAMLPQQQGREEKQGPLAARKPLTGRSVPFPHSALDQPD